MTCRKKFTLLELLVVIAIIGVLLTMLLPSLSKARYMARIAVCASSVKQNGTAMTAYSIANDQHVPTRGTYTSPQYHRYFWVSNINDFTVLGKVWQEGFISDPQTLFCAEANITLAGTFKSYEYYVENGSFSPISVVNNRGAGAARSNYVFYPYQTNNTNWNKLLLSKMDSEGMFLSDDLWTIAHNRTNTVGWNISKTDLSVKFIKNKSAYSYVQSQTGVWNDWAKTGTIRDFLMNSF